MSTVPAGRLVVGVQAALLAEIVAVHRVVLPSRNLTVPVAPAGK